MANQNSNKTAASCQQRIQGLNENVAAKTSIPIDGTNEVLADVVAVYQDWLDAQSALIKKRNEAKSALQTWEAAEAKRKSTDASLKYWALVTFGFKSQAVKDMGFAPNRPGVASVETKYQATLQSAATRKARQTIGKKAKQKIKGTVVVPTEPAAPATTASAGSAPANAAASTTSGPNGAAASNGVTPAH